MDEGQIERCNGCCSTSTAWSRPPWRFAGDVGGGSLLQGFVKQEMFLWVWSQLPVTVLPLDFLSELPTLPNGGPSPSVSHLLDCPWLVKIPRIDELTPQSGVHPPWLADPPITALVAETNHVSFLVPLKLHANKLVTLSAVLFLCSGVFINVSSLGCAFRHLCRSNPKIPLSIAPVI